MIAKGEKKNLRHESERTEKKINITNTYKLSQAREITNDQDEI